MDDSPTILKNTTEVLFPQVLKALTEPVESTIGNRGSEPEDRDIVFTGNADEVNRFFQKQGWSDGMPLVPPTIEKVEEFLKFTDRDANEVIGILPPRMGACTVWKVAVNGVMAGCRPEYMPVLLAIAEVFADPQFSLRDAGSTPGWESVVMLNGPIRDQLGFNYGVGVMRPGPVANTSIGRFYRLLLRNVAGFQTGSTDMSVFGQMFHVVVPENDQVCKEIGWKTLAEEQGFTADDNVVTITSVRAIPDPGQSMGDKAEQHLWYISDLVSRGIEPYESSQRWKESHVLFMSPVVAKLLAAQGYDKEKIVDWLKENTKVSARYFEMNTSNYRVWKPYNLCQDIKTDDFFDERWCQSEDPERMVPLIGPQSDIHIVVTGNPNRNRNMFYRQNQLQGYMTSKRIVLPTQWDKLRSELKQD